MKRIAFLLLLTLGGCKDAPKPRPAPQLGAYSAGEALHTDDKPTEWQVCSWSPTKTEYECKMQPNPELKMHTYLLYDGPGKPDRKVNAPDVCMDLHHAELEADVRALEDDSAEYRSYCAASLDAKDREIANLKAQLKKLKEDASSIKVSFTNTVSWNKEAAK